MIMFENGAIWEQFEGTGLHNFPVIEEAQFLHNL